VLTFVGKRADVALDDFEEWVRAAAVGLVRIAPDVDGATMNLRVFVGQCLAQSWMRPDRLPAVLSGVRFAMKERACTSDPLEPVLADAYRTLVGRHGHSLATPLLMSLVKSATETDRYTVARVVLKF
jgi:hypothetical protein